MSRPRLLLVALVAVAAAAAFGGYWFFLRDDAPPPAALPSDGSGAAPFSPGDADGTWTVQPGADVFAGYRIQEQFGGDTFKKTAVGRTPAVSGTATIDGDEVTAATITVDLTQLESDQVRRDRYVVEHGLETATFPTTTFTLTEPVDISAAKGRQDVHTSAAGDLVLHGVTAHVTIPIEARWNGTSIDITGTLPIVLADYKIDAPSIGGFVSVDDRGALEFQLSFVRTP